jgi:hypothetical protein
MIEAGFLHEKGADLHAEITTWTHLTRNQSTQLLYPLPLSMIAVAVDPGNPPGHDTGFVVRESRNSDSVPDKVRPIRILGHAVWIDQCTGIIPTVDERSVKRLLRRLLYRISRRHPNLLGRPRTTPPAHKKDSGKGRGGWVNAEGVEV